MRRPPSSMPVPSVRSPRASGLRPGRASVAGALLLAGGAVALPCCTSPTTTVATTVPITALVVQATDVVGSRGCGTAAGQVYRYVAVLRDPSGATIAAQVYDCFTDGGFYNLPIPDGGAAYAIDILVFGKATYDAESASFQYDAVSQLSLASLPSLVPDWRTTCTGIQQINVRVVAECQPIVSGSGAASTDAGGATDGGPGDAAGAQDAGRDASADAGPDAATTDAAAAADGAPPVFLSY